MKEKNLKLIMELIFIFILPLLIILPCVSIQNEFVYDNNGNFESSNKVISFDEPFNYIRDDHYINYINFYQICNVKSLVSNGNYSITFNVDSNDIIYFVIDLYVSCQFNNSGSSVSAIVNYSPTNYTYIYSSSYNIVGSNFLYDEHYENRFTASSDSFLFGVFFENSSNIVLNFDNFQVFNLTKMFGQGYEPSIEEFKTYFTDEYYDYNVDEEIILYSDDIISSNYAVNYSLMGKIKLLFTNYLDFNDSVVLNIFIAYNTLWLMMFICWHFLYSLFDFVAHLLKIPIKRRE